jgi:hypothetical protein
MVVIASVTRVYKQSENQTGSYDTFILSTFKNARWFKWKPGMPFNETYVDDKVYEVRGDLASEPYKIMISR